MKTPPTSRRRVLAAAGAATFAGCSRLGGEPSYGPADLELALDVACTDGDYGDESVVTVSWEWQSDDGGNDTPDLARISWDRGKWSLAEDSHETTEGVRWRSAGRRIWGTSHRGATTYEHDDGAAAVDTAYSASCRLVSTGNYGPDEHTVYAEFFHRPGDGSTGQEDETEGTPGGALETVDHAWRKVVESDAAAAPCEDGSA